jgi:hypothetical protein
VSKSALITCTTRATGEANPAAILIITASGQMAHLLSSSLLPYSFPTPFTCPSYPQSSSPSFLHFRYAGTGQLDDASNIRLLQNNNTTIQHYCALYIFPYFNVCPKVPRPQRSLAYLHTNTLSFIITLYNMLPSAGISSNYKYKLVPQFYAQCRVVTLCNSTSGISSHSSCVLNL